MYSQELLLIHGGEGPVIAVLIVTPFILGAIADGADEYARKRKCR